MINNLKKFKILFVIDSLCFGGAERQLTELVKGIKTNIESEIYITVACLIKDGNSYENELLKLGVPIFYFPRKYKLDLMPIYYLQKFILKSKFDIVHSYNNFGALFGGIAAKIANRPLVCSAIRDAKDWNLISKYSKIFLSIISDAYISNSLAGLRNRFKKFKKNFYVIYNGIDLNRFSIDEERIKNIKAKLNLTKYQYIVGMVASITKRKDHETLILAAVDIIKNYPNVCFIIVGDGDKKGKIVQLVNYYKLQNNFKFLGYRNDCDKITSIFDISILLTNTDYHFEGISNSIIEAMAMGIPIIATKGGGTNEIIENYKNGILVNYKDNYEIVKAFTTIINDKSLYTYIADNAKKTIRKRNNIEDCVKKHLEIYTKVLRK